MSMRVASNRPLPAFRSAAGAIAWRRNLPVSADGCGAATRIFDGAPTSTVKNRVLSASMSSDPSSTTRPCRTPGSSPVTSNSTCPLCPSFHVTGLTPLRAYRPSAPRISTATGRFASGPLRRVSTVSPNARPAVGWSVDRSIASSEKFCAPLAPTSTQRMAVSALAETRSAAVRPSQAPWEQSVKTTISCRRSGTVARSRNPSCIAAGSVCEAVSTARRSTRVSAAATVGENDTGPPPVSITAT